MQAEEYNDAEEFGLGYRYGFNDLRGFGDGVIEVAIEEVGAGFSDEFVRGLRLGREEGKEQERMRTEVVEVRSPTNDYETDEPGMDKPQGEQVRTRENELRQWEEDYEEWRLRNYEQEEGYEYI